MTTTESEADLARTVAVSRVMDVPAKYVFLAHARPEHLMRWFGPAGYPVTTCDIDFRVGGRWRMVMTGPDGREGPPFGGTYHEIVPYSRIVYDNAFEDGRGGDMNLRNEGRMLFTTTFEEQAGRTTVTTTVLFPSPEMRAEYLGVGMTEGMASAFDQLEVLVRELAAQG